jgi:RNA polymerase sigma factor (sigma-70 family)
MSLNAEAALTRDQGLWQRWRQGDPAAGAELLRFYEGALYRAMRCFGLKERAELEDVYGDFIVTLSEYKDKKSLESSFFGLARRMLLGLALRQKRKPVSEMLDLDGVEVADRAAPGPLQVAFHEALRHCLERLRPAEGQLFRERFLLDLDNATLAVRHAKTRSQIAVLVHRAAKKMRDCLERQGFQP